MSITEDAPGMAPPYEQWHRDYANLMGRFFDEVFKFDCRTQDEAKEHPDWEYGDLADWVDMLTTLLSFRPRTRDDIEKEESEKVHGKWNPKTRLYEPITRGDVV